MFGQRMASQSGRAGAVGKSHFHSIPLQYLDDRLPRVAEQEPLENHISIASPYSIWTIGCPEWPSRSRSCGLCWRSWAALGPYVGGLGALLGLCGRSWAALGIYVGGLGLLLCLCGRSWVALGTYLSGHGPLLRSMLAVLARSWALRWRSWAEKWEEHSYLENVLIS